MINKKRDADSKSMHSEQSVSRNHLSGSRVEISLNELMKRNFVSFVPSEETFSKPLPIPSGYFSFVQTNYSPYTIYVGSWHPFIVRKLSMENILLTVGELIIDVSHQLVAWSFKTGIYTETLKIKDVDIIPGIIAKKDTRLDDTRLPTNKFFFASIWQEYHHKYNLCLFNSSGGFRPEPWQFLDDRRNEFTKSNPNENSRLTIDEQNASCRFTGLHRVIKAASENYLKEMESKHVDGSENDSEFNDIKMNHATSPDNSQKLSAVFFRRYSSSNLLPGSVNHSGENEVQAIPPTHYRKSSRVPD